MGIRRYIRRTRRFVNQAVGRDVGFSPKSQVSLVTLGSRDACWTFTPATITNRSVVYSLGVGTDITFELALIEGFGVEVFAFDPTPKSKAWMARQALPMGLHYFPWGVAARDGTATFTLTTHPNWTSYQMGGDTSSAYDVAELPVRRLSSIVAELGHTHIDLLKMDIEGAEFEVIEQLASTDIRVSQLLVEFHYPLGNRTSMARVASTIRLVESMGLVLVARSDGGREFSFATVHEAATQQH